MKDQKKLTRNDKTLLAKLLSQPAVAKNKKSIQLASIFALIAGAIALIAGIAEITGFTVSGFFEQVSLDDAIRIDHTSNCFSEVNMLNSVKDERMMGVSFKEEEYNIIKEYLSKPGDKIPLQDSGILSLCTGPLLTIDVVGQSKFEHVKLAPFLVVRIVQITPHPKGIKYSLLPGLGGASGSIHEAHAVLSPNQDEITAAILTPSKDMLEIQSKTVADFFTLSPGEHEVFAVTVSSQPGYTYSYRLGVYYSYKGNKRVKWIDKTFTSDGITNEMKIVNFDLKFVEEVQLVNQTVVEEYNDKIREVREVVRKESFFTLDEINN